MMKKVFLLALVATMIAACQQNPASSLPDKPQKIDYPVEVQEAVSNDFTLLKAGILKNQAENATLLTANGFTLVDNTYVKTRDSITIEAMMTLGNCYMTAHTKDFNKAKSIFSQWMKEIQQSASYTNLVRSSCHLCVGGEGNRRHVFNNPNDLLAALDTLSCSLENMSASFEGNDIFANQYSLIMFPDLGGVYLQIINQRAGQPSDTCTESDLQEADLHKHILICKVDYLTFRYEGFYALKVSGKQETGKEIPFVAEYEEPNDFGNIKLFYGSKNNLLLDGAIIWNGCGKLAFPEQFRAGLPTDAGIAYPGTERVAMITENGQYSPILNEREIKYIWESVSKQKEFQYYFTNSTKKLAIFLYTPSVGLMNPADADYLIFTEQ